MVQAEIGIIGGSGLYAMPGLSKVKEVRLKTPFGAPSDAYVCGMLEGRKVAFLARHGRGHRISAERTEFSREYSWVQAAWCRENRFGFRGRVAEGRTQAAGFRDSGSVLRSYAPSHRYIFRRRSGGARRFCRSGMRRTGGSGRGGLQEGRRDRQARRNLFVHGRSAVFH